MQPVLTNKAMKALTGQLNALLQADIPHTLAVFQDHKEIWVDLDGLKNTLDILEINGFTFDSIIKSDDNLFTISF